MNFICISRREKVVPQRKQRRVTMFSASLRSANKIIDLILTLKSSLAVVDCWLASLPDQVNAAELMGELEETRYFFCKHTLSVGLPEIVPIKIPIADTSWKERNWSSI